MKALLRDPGVRMVAALFALTCIASAGVVWKLAPLSNGTDPARYERFFEPR